MDLYTIRAREMCPSLKSLCRFARLEHIDNRGVVASHCENCLHCAHVCEIAQSLPTIIDRAQEILDQPNHFTAPQILQHLLNQHDYLQLVACRIATDRCGTCRHHLHHLRSKLTEGLRIYQEPTIVIHETRVLIETYLEQHPHTPVTT